jgi:hypothetical protein
VPIETAHSDIAHGTLQEIAGDTIIFAPAHTAYRLQLAIARPAADLAAQVGKRIEGRIHASALRLFVARAGGKFIEPLVGAPRIVQGRVRAVEAAQNRILIDAAAPMWMKLSANSAAEFEPGQMVNCYVQSGASFERAAH